MYSSFRRWRYGERDFRDEGGQLLLVLMAVAAFFISSYYSWIELKYLATGQTVPGQITRTYTQRIPTKYGHREKLAVVFTYETANREHREGKQLFPMQATYRVGDQVEVQYQTSEKNVARLAGTGNSLAVLIFVGTLLFVAYSLWAMAREANSPIPRSRNRRV